MPSLYVACSIWVIWFTSGVAAHRDGVAAGLAVAFAHAGVLYVTDICRRKAGRRLALKVCLALVCALYWTFQAILGVYALARGIPLDPRFAADHVHEVVPTLIAIYGTWRLAAALAATLVFFLVMFSAGLSNSYQRATARRAGATCMGAAIVAFATGTASPGYLLFPHLLLVRMSHMEDSGDQAASHLLDGEIVRDFTLSGRLSGESVFILQLESVNALALKGLGTGRDPAELSPVLYSTSREGILFPMIWGPSVQTHRGMAAILCGSVLDTGRPLSEYPDAEQLGGCLPGALRALGYSTAYLSAHWQPSFFDLERFVRHTGFDDVQFSTMMSAEDPRLSWGYYDCAFYNRAFDDLERRYGRTLHERFLGYFEVSSTHFPFTETWPPEAHLPFPDRSTIDTLRQYLNAHSMQDRCVGTFLERVAPYRDNAHVFIVGDHSYPVGLAGSKWNEKGATTEHFLTVLMYLPPRTKEARFSSGLRDKRPLIGQEEIGPTILELLSGNPEPESFVPLLESASGRRGDGYEDCYVLTQPYDGERIAIVRGTTKYTYLSSERKLLITNLSDDLTELPVLEGAENLGLRAFFDRYLCARYRPLLSLERYGRHFVLPAR